MYIALADENVQHYIPRISIQDIFRQFETAITFQQSYANIYCVLVPSWHICLVTGNGLYLFFSYKHV